MLMVHTGNNTDSMEQSIRCDFTRALASMWFAFFSSSFGVSFDKKSVISENHEFAVLCIVYRSSNV